jgi:hypothetical protein
MELFFCVFLDHETYSKGVFLTCNPSVGYQLHDSHNLYSTKKGYLYNVQVLLMAIV